MDRPALRALIDAFKPADPQEAAHQAAMLDLLTTGSDPFSREHFVPGHFTASAFVLHPTEEAILLIYHGKLHRWLQPGGHLEPTDADVYAAAHREVAEETGLTDLTPMGGLFDLDVHVIPARKADPAHRHFDVRVLLRARSEAIAAGSDARDARWVPLREVNGVESDASVMRAVAKLQG